MLLHDRIGPKANLIHGEENLSDVGIPMFLAYRQVFVY